MKRIIGRVYYLENFTAPKVFNGYDFECLLTDQKIKAETNISKDTGVNLKEWSEKYNIYKPERFKSINKNTER